MFEAFETQDAVRRPPWFAAFEGEGSAFVPDGRFHGGSPQPAAPADPVDETDHQAELDAARTDGFAAGVAHATREAEAKAREEDAARARLALSFQRLDGTAQRELADRLAETVARLCEETLAPLALDRDRLEQRCADAARRLGEAQETLTLYLHPDDIPALGEVFVEGWKIEADPLLARGALRLEGSDGGISDGPVEWAAALRAAFAAC